MFSRIVLRALAAIALLAAPAAAEPLLYEKGGNNAIGLTLGAKAGLDFAQPFNELGMSPAAELEIGWQLPALERAIEIFVAGQWANPTGNDALATDPRLPGDGVARYDVSQEHLRLSLGALYRIPVGHTVRPYAGLGARAWLVRSTMTAAADGAPFGEYTEESTEYGGFATLGVEWHVSIGALLFEVQGGYATQDRTIFEGAAVGTLNASLGWRFFL